LHNKRRKLCSHINIMPPGKFWWYLLLIWQVGTGITCHWNIILTTRDS
jgi:hypothetical protein